MLVKTQTHEIELHICTVSEGSWKLIKRTASAHTEGHFGKALQRVWKQALNTRLWVRKKPKKQQRLAGTGRELKLFLPRSVIQALPQIHPLLRKKQPFFRRTPCWPRTGWQGSVPVHEPTTTPGLSQSISFTVWTQNLRHWVWASVRPSLEGAILLSHKPMLTMAVGTCLPYCLRYSKLHTPKSWFSSHSPPPTCLSPSQANASHSSGISTCQSLEVNSLITWTSPLVSAIGVRILNATHFLVPRVQSRVSPALTRADSNLPHRHSPWTVPGTQKALNVSFGVTVAI